MQPHEQAGPGLFGFADRPWMQGEIDRATGKITDAGPFVFTSVLAPVRDFTDGYLSVSKFLGYQGLQGRTWNYTAAFYDASTNFLSAESAFQFRPVRIPSGSAFLRISLPEESAEAASKRSLTVAAFRLPYNSAFKNVVFEKNRCVAMAPAALRNFLVKGCEFRRSGESLACCAIDAEDGWDLMQDFFLEDCVFEDNPVNDFLACAGHNFVLERNKGTIYLYGRVLSPCVRNNVTPAATFECHGREFTMHGRYENNTYTGKLLLGALDRATGWDAVISQNITGTPDHYLFLHSSKTGRFRDCAFSGGIDYAGDNYERCVFTNGAFILTRQSLNLKDLDFNGTFFQHANLTNVWDRCTLTNCRIAASRGGDLSLTGCTLSATTVESLPWTTPMRVRVLDSRIDLGEKGTHLINLPLYSIADIQLRRNAFVGGASGATALTIPDCQPQPTDAAPATVALEGNAFGPAYGPLVRILDTASKTVKKLTLSARDNKTEAPLVNADALREGWTVE